MRRKRGALVPLELAICEVAVALRRDGLDQFHGYQVAKMLGDAADSRLLTAYGTLYRALARLERLGMLTSRWEDPEIPAREARPGRRFYTLTALGETAIAEAHATAAVSPSKRSRRRLVPA